MTISAFAATFLDSLPSVLDFLHLGLTLLAHSLIQVSSAVLVLDSVHLGFPVLPRSLCQPALPLLPFGVGSGGLRSSVLDNSLVDFFVSMHSFGHPDFLLLAFGSADLDLSTLIQSST